MKNVIFLFTFLYTFDKIESNRNMERRTSGKVIFSLKCDRCGSVYTPDIVSDQNERLNVNVSYEDGESKTLDLCPLCYISLGKWYNEE